MVGKDEVEKGKSFFLGRYINLVIIVVMRLSHNKSYLNHQSAIFTRAMF